jgi:hypothetical protein
LTDDDDNQHVYMKDKDINKSQNEPIFYILHNLLYLLVSSIKASSSLQNGNCYYSYYINSTNHLVPQIHTLTEMLSIPFQLRLFIGITITILLMTYLIMPLLTKLLRPWLFRISK